MSCVFPGAPTVQAYWQNILNKVNAIGDPPPEWESELFLDPSVEANDRVYCARGGYLGALAEFDPDEVRHHAELRRRHRAGPFPRAAIGV